MSNEMRKYINDFRNLLIENKLEKIFNYYLTKFYGNVELIKSDNEILFNKNGDTVFTYNKKFKGPTMSWFFRNELCSMFGINDNDCEDMFDKWFSENFENLEVNFNRKDWARNYEKNKKSKIKTYNEFFGLEQPENWGRGNGITVDTIKDQIVENLTDGYDLSDINKDVLKREVDRFAQKWYRKVRNLDYDSAIYKTSYISETDEWDEFLGDIEF
jgi:hypothetical protein